MTIERITAAQFREQIRRGITSRSSAIDTAYGPVRDVVIDPMAAVLEQQNDRIRRLSLLVSLVNSTEYTDEELDDLVFNEGITRIEGTTSIGTVRFTTARVDTTGPDLVVPRGFPISTQAGVSGDVLTFVTTESQTLDVSNAASYLDTTIDPPLYVLTIPVVSLSTGVEANVGIGRLTRPLRPIPFGFTAVSNDEPTTGGADRETNEELIERYLLAVLGRDISTPTGIDRYIRDTFGDVEDVNVVYGSNPLLLRAEDEAGAVDAYIIGDQLITRVEDFTYLGPGQLIELTYPPMREVVTVTNQTTPTTYTEETHYEVIDDASNHSGSVRGADGVEFIVGASGLPTVGDTIRITYTSNELVRRVQVDLDTDDHAVIGRDLLIREGIQVNILFEANLRVTAGFNAASVQSSVSTAISDFINGLELGANVEVSDIQGAVRTLSGVDNLIITRLVRDPTFTGAADIVIEENEYARIASGDIDLNII